MSATSPPVQVVMGLHFLFSRQAIAEAIRLLRPAVIVHEVEPSEVGAASERFQPDIVIGSAVEDLAGTTCPVWIVLYPDDANLGIVNISGTRQVIPDIALNDVIGFIDLVAIRPSVASPTHQHSELQRET